MTALILATISCNAAMVEKVLSLAPGPVVAEMLRATYFHGEGAEALVHALFICCAGFCWECWVRFLSMQCSASILS